MRSEKEIETMLELLMSDRGHTAWKLLGFTARDYTDIVNALKWVLEED